MEKLFNSTSIFFTAIGTFLVSVFGGCDKWLIALISFVVLDYLSGVIKAIINKKLDSSIGFKGICKKLLIFICVAASVAVEKMIDVPVREIVVCFYCANEGISLLENLAESIPVPDKLKKILLQLRNKDGDKSENSVSR